MELWDAYDKNFNKIEGMALVRGEEDSIPKGVYHMVVFILVRHTDGQYLIMQRDACKAYPLMWEATAGGSVLQGETALEGALRELREETGIHADTLEEKMRYVKDDTRCVHVAYLCVTDCDKESIILQEGETCAYKWVDKEYILAMPDDEILAHTTRQYIE